MSSFNILQCSEDDFADRRIADLVFDTFGHTSTILNALFPDHDTVTGRDNAEKLFKAGFLNPTQHWLKAVNSCGKIAGVAQYILYDKFEENPFKAGPLTGRTWATEEDKQWARNLQVSLIANRNKLTADKPSKIAVLNLLAISPAHQRSGIGSKLVLWGVEWANSHECDLILDATVEGRPLYEKYGYKTQFVADLDVPAAFADRPKSSLIFMRRPHQ